MKHTEELKNIVKEKYGKIARQDKEVNAASCCGATDVSNKVYNIMMDDYTQVEGYVADADLGLGCGLPTKFAMIRRGDTVIDLGSGAGNDCFIARHETGETGKVIGIDFSEPMIEKARSNAEKMKLNNVEFRYGDLEKMPVNGQVADVVISNCVLNLVPNKKAVFAEIFRVLKPGGHFSISDIVLVGVLPEALRQDAEMYAGCVAGAIQKEAYLSHIRDLGFTEITIQKEKTIRIPEDILEKYLSPQETKDFLEGETGIFSITVFARKPGQPDDQKKPVVKESGCDPESGCC